MTVSIVALLLRIGLGLTFLFAGLEKVLGGVDRVVTYFRDLGIPWPEIFAPLVAYLELLGGVALLIGLLTAPTGVLLAAEMVVAVLVVRLPEAIRQGSLAPAYGAIRLEVLLILVALSLALLGPGRWSVDAARDRRITVRTGPSSLPAERAASADRDRQAPRSPVTKGR